MTNTQPMNTFETKTTLIIILTNLIIGNGILLFGGKSSFGGDVNYLLMAGMSIACVIFYFLFFRYSGFETYSNLKLILLSVLSCMVIVFLGNLFALLIKEPINEVFSNLFATLLMGIMGNILLFPISLILGLLNFGIITYLKKLLLIAILPFMISCNGKNDKLVNSNNQIAIDTIGKINIEKISFEKFDIMDFYKNFNYKDIKTASDTTSDFTRHRFYKKENFGLPYNLDKVNPDYYFPDLEYHTEEEMDEWDYDFKDSISTYSRSFPSIAYFRNIEFDYVSFTTKKNDPKPIAYLFSTIRSTDSLNFDNKTSILEQELGNPLSKLRVSNGYYTIIKSNTWLIDGKYYQFYEDDELNGQRINLLVIDEKDLATFNKEENMRFPIIHLNEEMIKERYAH